ncbi:hypothetical protein ACFS6H_20125 [Terrimonas rubra]|uniref:Uncharacterized protein n=1 Tax=Terrimonas rubra TaxID=1035890 RepID=A0ABW6A9H2_9BACT
MPDLSAYIDFDVLLNKSTEKLIVTGRFSGTSGILGDGSGLSGTISVMHPDSVWEKKNLTFSIVSPSTEFFVFETVLRLDVLDRIQNGCYKVNALVKLTGYDDTLVNKTINLNYESPKISLKSNFDLITPALSFDDITVYQKAKFTLADISRLWNITIKEKGSFTSNSQAPDLLYEGGYYDAEYRGTLSTTIRYNSVQYPFLSIIDLCVGSICEPAVVLPPYGEIPDYLEYIDRSTSKGGCGCSCESKEYKKAFLAYQKLQKIICTDDLETIQLLLLTIHNIFYKVKGCYKHTNNTLSYDRSFCENGVGDNIEVLRWYGDIDPYSDLLAGNDTLTYLAPVTIASNASAVNVNFPSAASSDLTPDGKFFVIKVPISVTVKTKWENGTSVYNKGDIPDISWRAPFTSGQFRYYVTRTALILDYNVVPSNNITLT